MGRRQPVVGKSNSPAAPLGEQRRLLRWLAEATLSPPRSSENRRRRSPRLRLRLWHPAAAKTLGALAHRLGCRSCPRAHGRGATLELAARRPLLTLLERAAGLFPGSAAAAAGAVLPAAAPPVRGTGHRCRLRQGWRRLRELAAALGLGLRPQRWPVTGTRSRRGLRLLLGAYGAVGSAGYRLRLTLTWPVAQTAHLQRLQRRLGNRQRRQRHGWGRRRLELASHRTLERLLLLAGPPLRRWPPSARALGIRGQRLLERLAAGLRLRWAERCRNPQNLPAPPEPNPRQWRQLLRLLAGAGGVGISGQGRPLLWLQQPPKGFGALAALPPLLGSRAQPRPRSGRRPRAGGDGPPPEERWRLSLSGRRALERLVELTNGRRGPLLAQLRLRRLCRLLGQPHRFGLRPSCRCRLRPPAAGWLEGVAPHRWWWRPRGPRSRAEWYRWAAGLVDGDGHLRARHRGGAELAVTTHPRSRPLLQRLRRLLGGGTIYRLRNGLLRYVLGRPPELRRMVRLLGPHLRLAHRRRQLAAVAAALGEPLPPAAAEPPGGWLVGGLESDGSVGLRDQGPGAAPHPFVELGNTDPAFLEPYQRLFGGRVRKDLPPQKASHRQSYRWTLTGRRPLGRLLAYCRRLPYAGPKGKRLALLPEYYRLRDRGCHRPEHEEHRRWQRFWRRWSRLRSDGRPAAALPQWEKAAGRRPKGPVGPGKRFRRGRNSKAAALRRRRPVT